jgi:hypothetical protein
VSFVKWRQPSAPSRSWSAYLFLACRCGRQKSLETSPESADLAVAIAGWELPSIAEEAVGARDRCPRCLTAERKAA